MHDLNVSIVRKIKTLQSRIVTTKTTFYRRFDINATSQVIRKEKEICIEFGNEEFNLSLK